MITKYLGPWRKPIGDEYWESGCLLQAAVCEMLGHGIVYGIMYNKDIKTYYSPCDAENCSTLEEAIARFDKNYAFANYIRLSQNQFDKLKSLL